MEPVRRGRPRSEPFEDQRARVLEAARLLFTRDGYDVTTVAEIARQADVPRPVVYETVGDKPAVLATVADQVADELIAAFGERLGAIDAHLGATEQEGVRSPAALVHDTVAWFTNQVRLDPSIVAVVRLSALLPAEQGHGAHRARRGIEDLLTTVNQTVLPDRPGGNEPSARMLALMIVAMTEAVAYRAAEEDWSSDSVAALIAAMTLGGFRQVLETRSGREAVRRFDDEVGGR